MKFYIQSKPHQPGLPFNEDGFMAVEGAETTGLPFAIKPAEWLLEFYTERLTPATAPDKLLVASVFTTLNVLKQWGVAYFNPWECYTDVLADEVGFLGIKSVAQLAYPCFVKPTEPKAHLGGLAHSEADVARLMGLPTAPPETNVAAFRPWQFSAKSEWRAYIHQGRVVDVRPYVGFSPAPPVNWVSTIIERLTAWGKMPVAYTVDIAMDADAGCHIIEIGDMWSVGSYGLDPETYLQMLSDRWQEMVGDNRSLL